MIRPALVLVVAISAALASIWLAYVPLLQNPDESAHADYAYALLDVGHPYRVSQPQLKKDVTAQIRYLERATSFYGVRDLDGFRVPLAYGNSAYMRDVASRAPHPSLVPPKNGSAVPYVMFSYPAGYYAVVATTMWFAAHVVHGSFVTAFFLSRGLSVVALVVTLAVSYALLVELRFRNKDALVGTAAIGFFPLTSWVSSYIQPDNFVASGAALALLLALRLKRAPFTPIVSLWLGATIGCLALVKIHYAIVLFIVVAFMLSSQTLLRARSWAKIVRGWTLFASPALFGIALAPFATPIGHLSTPVRNAGSTDLRLGITIANSISDIARNLMTVSTDAFVSGISFHRYWNSFGWLDNSFYGKSALSSIIETSLSIISLFTLSVVITRQVAISRRIGHVFKRRSRTIAFRLVARDVAFNCYVLWSILLIGVFSVSPASGSSHGRYWLPVFVPLLYIVATRLSKLSIAGVRLRMRTVVPRMFLAYSVFSAPFAIHAMFEHYYGPNQHVSNGPIVTLDRVGRIGVHSYATSVYDIDAHKNARLHGWVIRSTDGSRLAKARFVIDGRVVIPVVLKGDEAWDPFKRSIGFHAVIPAGKISAGNHRMIFEELDESNVRSGWNDAIRLHVADFSASRS